MTILFLKVGTDVRTDNICDVVITTGRDCGRPRDSITLEVYNFSGFSEMLKPPKMN